MGRAFHRHIWPEPKDGMTKEQVADAAESLMHFHLKDAWMDFAIPLDCDETLPGYRDGFEQQIKDSSLECYFGFDELSQMYTYRWLPNEAVPINSQSQ